MDVNLAEAPDQLNAFAAMVWAWALAFLPRFGAALLLLIAGIFVAGWASRLVRRALHRTRHVDPTAIPVIGTAIRYAILIVVIVAVLGQIGIQTTSLLAVLGAAGLAIGLALQGTLSNIAAGLMSSISGLFASATTSRRRPFPESSRASASSPRSSTRSTDSTSSPRTRRSGASRCATTAAMRGG